MRLGEELLSARKSVLRRCSHPSWRMDSASGAQCIMGSELSSQMNRRTDTFENLPSLVLHCSHNLKTRKSSCPRGEGWGVHQSCPGGTPLIPPGQGGTQARTWVPPGQDRMVYPLGNDLWPVTGKTPCKEHGTSGSIKGWRWGSPQKGHETSGSIKGWRWGTTLGVDWQTNWKYNIPSYFVDGR